MSIKESNKETQRTSLDIKCASCIHFKRGPAAFEKKCIDRGVQRYASACERYTPDSMQLTDLGADTLAQLGMLLKDASPNQLQILAYTFRSMNIIAKHGLKFSQPVYFSLGGEYLSHYFKGYVIGASRDGAHIYVASTLKEAKKTTYAVLMAESILTGSQFKQKKAELLEKDKIEMELPEWKKSKLPIPQVLDKKGRMPRPKKQYDIDYVPPTLDTAPTEWLANVEAPKEQLFDSPAKKKKKKVDATLKTSTTKGGLKTIQIHRKRQVA